LGPVLFLIYYGIKNWIFADDTEIFSRVSDPEPEDCVSFIQRDLYNLVRWFGGMANVVQCWEMQGYASGQVGRANTNSKKLENE